MGNRVPQGYKVHVSETCDNVTDPDPDADPDAETADTPQPPNLITNVVTTHAAVADIAMTPR